jgi:hypothetical protein
MRYKIIVRIEPGYDAGIVDAKALCTSPTTGTCACREFRPYANQHPCGTLIADLGDAHFFVGKYIGV